MAKKSWFPAESSLIQPGASAAFRGSQEPSPGRSVTLGSPLEGGRGLFLREEGDAGARCCPPSPWGLLGAGKTWRVQFWCARPLHPFSKTKQEHKPEHRHSINAIPGSPPFSPPVLLVCTVWVFIIFCLFGPSSLALRNRLAGQSLFFPPRAGMPVFGRRGGRRAGGDRAAGCGGGAAWAVAVAAATLGSLRPAFTARWSAARGAAAACRR